MEMMNSAAGGGGGAVMGYPDSVDSSPRSRGGESWDEPFPSSASKLRLMCSYGGRIVPRPTDRSLCYLGGDTRIVVVERHTTLADLSAKLSRSLLGGQNFTLKYQLPNEDLDSLISVTTDEDLDNMIDEYDRIVALSSAGSGSGSSRSSRLRLFLFPSKLESAPSSIGSLLDDSKSENWFVDALNGAIGMDGLPRGLSADSSSVNCLLGLEDDSSVKSRSGISASAAASVGAGQPEHEQLLPRPDSSGKLTRQDIHSVPDSPMVETTSSFGSTSSAPYLSNLPPIRVRPDDRPLEQRIGGLEDHFSQMNISSAAAMAAASAPGQRLTDEGGFREPNYPFQHPPPLTNPISTSSISQSENPNRKTFSDEEKFDQVAINKQQQQLPPPQQQQPPPQQQQQTQQQQQQQQTQQQQQQPQPPVLQQKPNNLDPDPPEPIARPVYYPDRVSTNTAGMNPIPDPKRDVPISSYVLTSMPPAEQQFRPHPSHVHQFQQQQQQPPPQPQFIQANPNHQYIHHPATGTVLPYPTYYQMPIQQSQQSHPYDQQQFSVYYLPVRQNPPPPQPYNMPIATPLPDVSSQGKPAAATTFSKPLPAKPELQQANLYRMAAMPPPQPTNASQPPTTVSQPQLQPLIHLASDQAHPYSGMGYHVMHHHHPSQQQPATAAATPVAANYGYEFATDPTGIPPVYYTQTTSPPGMAAQPYQTVVTSPDAAAAAAAVSALQSGEVKQTRAS